MGSRLRQCILRRDRSLLRPLYSGGGCTFGRTTKWHRTETAFGLSVDSARPPTSVWTGWQAGRRFASAPRTSDAMWHHVRAQRRP